MKNIKITVPAHLNYSEAIRNLAMQMAENAWATKKERNMVRLIMDELFMNAVIYWSDEDSVVSIEWYYENSELNVAVEDEGKWKNKVKATQLKKLIKDEVNNKDLKKTHGRWLAQITSIMTDKFEIKDWKMWWIRVEFMKKLWKDNDERIWAKHNIKPDLGEATEKEFDLSWEITASNADDIVKPIIEYIESIEHPAVLIFNCENLEYINTSFLGLLASWYASIDLYWGTLVIKKPKTQIIDMLDLVWISKIIKIQL